MRVLFDSLAGLLFDSLAGLHRNYLLDNIYQKGEVKLSDMRLRWMFDENFVESLLLRLGHRPSRPVTIQSAANKRGHVKTNLRARAYRPISFGSFISDLVRLQQTNKSRITRCLRSAYAAAPIKSGTRISRVAFTCQRHHQASPNGQDAIGGIATSSRSLRGSACTRCTDGGPQKISCACLKGSNKETAIPINRDTNAPTRTATSGPRLRSPRPAPELGSHIRQRLCWIVQEKIRGGGAKGNDARRARWMPKHSLKDTAWTTAQPEGCTNAAMISVEAQGWRSELPSVTMDKDDKTHKSLFRSEPSVANPDETRSRDTSHAIPRSCEDKRVLR